MIAPFLNETEYVAPLFSLVPSEPATYSLILNILKASKVFICNQLDVFNGLYAIIVSSLPEVDNSKVPIRVRIRFVGYEASCPLPNHIPFAQAN